MQQILELTLVEEMQTLSQFSGIFENTRLAQHQNTYEAQYNKLAERSNSLKASVAKLDEEIMQLRSMRSNIEAFTKAFKELPKSITEFSVDMFNALVLHMTVYSADDIRVTFRDGSEI